MCRTLTKRKVTGMFDLYLASFLAISIQLMMFQYPAWFSFADFPKAHGKQKLDGCEPMLQLKNARSDTLNNMISKVNMKSRIPI